MPENDGQPGAEQGVVVGDQHSDGHGDRTEWGRGSVGPQGEPAALRVAVLQHPAGHRDPFGDPDQPSTMAVLVADARPGVGHLDHHTPGRHDGRSRSRNRGRRA